MQVAGQNPLGGSLWIKVFCHVRTYDLRPGDWVLLSHERLEPGDAAVAKIAGYASPRGGFISILVQRAGRFSLNEPENHPALAGVDLRLSDCISAYKVVAVVRAIKKIT